MLRLRQSWNRILEIVGWGSMLAIFLMMALVATEVLGRNLFNLSIVGTVEIVSSLMVVSSIFAWSYTQSKDGHVKVEFVVQSLSPIARMVVEAIVTLMMLAILTIMLWQTTGYALEAWHRGITFETVGIPAFPFRLAVPVGCLFLSIQVLSRLATIGARLFGFPHDEPIK